jgi:hypothetical protein
VCQIFDRPGADMHETTDRSGWLSDLPQDHASWHEVGVPSSFASQAVNARDPVCQLSGACQLSLPAFCFLFLRILSFHQSSSSIHHLEAAAAVRLTAAAVHVLFTLATFVLTCWRTRPQITGEDCPHHTVEDALICIDFSNIVDFAKLAVAYVVELHDFIT